MSKLPVILSQARRWLFLRLVANGTLQAAAIIISMLLVRHAFDVLLNPEFDDPEVHMFEFDQVWEIAFFALGLLGSTGFAAWLRYIERIDAERLGQAYIHEVRIAVFDRMSRFAPRALSGRTTGSSMLRFVGDLSAIRRWISLGLARIVVSAIVTIISIGVLAFIDLLPGRLCDFHPVARPRPESQNGTEHPPGYHRGTPAARTPGRQYQ